jgi:16S rRNA (guanine(966)-N(2))-methyltransferase RsmD
MKRRATRNRVRIVGGRWRSRLLRFPDLEGLRPTPDRVRETLFNWLGQDLSGRTCLDLFAGSGVLGLEAASRGASLVVLVERDAEAFRALQANAAALAGADPGVQLVRSDALEFLRSDTRRYDVVFLDPPYAMRGREALLAHLRGRVAPRALVYVEAPRSEPPPPGWQAWRSARAGAVHYQLLRLEADDHNPEPTRAATPL